MLLSVFHILYCNSFDMHVSINNHSPVQVLITIDCGVTKYIQLVKIDTNIRSKIKSLKEQLIT